MDDLVVIAETEDDLIKRLNEWKDNMENRGMRVNMNKTKVMISAIFRSWLVGFLIHSFSLPSAHLFTGWMPFLSPNQQCESTDEKVIWPVKLPYFYPKWPMWARAVKIGPAAFPGQRS